MSARGNKNRIVISKTEYDKIVRAKEYLLEIWAFERRFMVMIENYLDFEKLLLNYSIEGCVETLGNISHGPDKMMHAERMLTNCLSAMKRYVDHGKSRVRRSAVFSDEDVEFYNSMIKNAEQNSLEFRTASAVRNVAQHADTVITQLMFGSSRQDHDGVVYFEKAVIPNVDFDELASLATRKHDRQILKDVRESGVTDARVICRMAIKHLGEIHNKFMDRIREQDTTQIFELNSAHDSYMELHGKSEPGLAVFMIPKSAKQYTIHYISKRLLDGFLETKTRFDVSRLDVMYACNHPVPKSRSLDHDIPPKQL